MHHLIMTSCDFRPSWYYEEVSEWHVCNAGLEFKLDFGTDVNLARLCTTDATVGPEPSSLAERAALTKVAAAGDERDDAAAVASRVLAAADANRPDELRYAIRTCFATAALCAPALATASLNGFADVAVALIDAGVDPRIALPKRRGKCAMHIACERGHENVASLLLAAAGAAAIRDVDDAGATPLDLARRADLNGMARRLEALAAAATESSPRRVTIFGYGSLMDPSSVRRTMPSAARHRRGTLRNYARVFSLVSLSHIKWLAAGEGDAAAAVQQKEIAAVALRPAPDAVVEGALFDIDVEEVEAYKTRERRYEFVTASVREEEGGALVEALVCIESDDVRYKAKGTFAADSAGVIPELYDGPLWGVPNLLPAPRYLTLCRDAARVLGGGEMEERFLDQSLLADGRTTVRQYCEGITEIVGCTGEFVRWE